MFPLIAGVPIAVFDIEVWLNIVIIGLLLIDSTGATLYQYTTMLGIGLPITAFRDWFAIRRHQYVWLSFNGSYYDIPIVRALLAGDTPDEVFALSGRLISSEDDRRPRYAIDDEVNIDLRAILKTDHGKLGGLKSLGCKVGFRRLAETPWPFDHPLPLEHAAAALAYNANDLDVTRAVAEVAAPLIEMRLALMQEYGNARVLNRPNAGLAETLIQQMMFGENRASYPYTRHFVLDGGEMAERFGFLDPELRALLDRLRDTLLKWDVVTDIETGERTVEGSFFHDEVRVRDVTYKLGKGGLHSDDGPMIYESDDRFALWDMDCTSAYPATIVRNGFAPAHLNRGDFLTAYDRLRQRRLQTKAEGNEPLSSGLKQAVNGAFGKGGSQFSFVFDPATMTRVTLTMQLVLLQLVDFVAVPEIRVVSANTDGLLLFLPRDQADDLRAKISAFARTLGFDLEWQELRRYARRDVNSYVALTADGKIKAKGAYAFDRTSWESLSKKDTTTEGIVTIAAQRHLLFGDDPAAIIADCTEVSLFTNFEAVGRAYQIQTADGTPVGQVARFYHATPGLGLDLKKCKCGTDKRAKLADSVLLADDLPAELPVELDRAWYVERAWAKIRDITEPKEVATWQLPLAELSQAQRSRLAEAQATRTADPDHCAAFDLARYQDDWANCYRGNRHDTAYSILCRAWYAGRGQVNAGDLLWLGQELTEAEGYFAGDKQRELRGIVEHITRKRSPFRLPQTDREVAERALTWALESVKRLTRRRPRVHRALPCSDFVTGTMMRTYDRIQNDYKLACAIAAIGVKNGISMTPDFVERVLRDTREYCLNNPSKDSI